MHGPMVSVALPTYNGEKYLKASIDSILNQTYPHFEIIAVVDGSTDSTTRILKSYSDGRIKIIDNGGNIGLPASLNVGLKAARGDLWTWFSDDDEYLPEAFAVMVEYMKNNPEAACVRTDIFIIDEKGKLVKSDSQQEKCFMVKTEIARKIGGFRPEFMLVEDIDFLFRLKHETGPIHHIPRNYFRYRVHSKSLSSTRIRERQIISITLHCDLISRGIEQGDFRELFFDRLKTAAFYNGLSQLDEICSLARSKGVPFADDLQRAADFYKTRIGRLRIQLEVHTVARLGRFAHRISDLLISIKRRTIGPRNGRCG